MGAVTFGEPEGWGRVRKGRKGLGLGVGDFSPQTLTSLGV